MGRLWRYALKFTMQNRHRDDSRAKNNSVEKFLAAIAGEP